ncbi:type I restriction-modification system subunit M N-terminal domain-containing protein [Sphingobium sp. Cam5-1]|uniref:type I restriction-modification system subunit M N-terminal domain-containing protein n=1 Tax=Sphingobium sp. Cam5-1 TaxID=2789327 RepID=UPI0018AD1E8C|nr:type I restriction-modification system subunit M N-terminal domain-containing protein [Sphingobium sp. Cam5-1]QPI71737.1 type I restriction-modification system subunit M N-terminal domain-containing protein [Sphingobium sp. Cam5-1]
MSVDLQDLSRRLFKTAEQLWTNTALRPDQYAQPVLALIALRQMEARFDLVHSDLSKTFTGRLKPTPQDYHGHGAVFLPDHARFSYLLGLPETENLAEALNAAMEAITEHNPDLAGVLPRGYGALPSSVLREVLRLLSTPVVMSPLRRASRWRTRTSAGGWLPCRRNWKG